MNADYAHYSLLIVDDAHFARFLIKKNLAELNFGKIIEADSGAQLLELYEIHRPNLVLADIIMRDTDGASAVRRLLREHPGARVVIVSAIDVPDFLGECIDLGALDFVVKPFRGADLVEAVRNALDAPVRVVGAKSGDGKQA